MIEKVGNNFSPTVGNEVDTMIIPSRKSLRSLCLNNWGYEKVCVSFGTDVG